MHFDRDGPAFMSISFFDVDGNEIDTFFPKMTQATQSMQTKKKKSGIHAEPDSELLEFQKQRKTPTVKLSEMNMEGAEVVHAEVTDFAA